jgi:pilus assembly protein FimV
LEKPVYLGGGVAALLLGILGWMMFNRRRYKNLAQLEQSVINSGDDFKTAIFRTTVGTPTQTATTQQQTSVMTDFSRLGLGAIDTHEVDPIAEAEVYMAYGRDAQAEEILKEALNKDPGRQEIAMKLLEIYAARRDTLAFETQASEIYAAIAGQPTPLWAKVTELGRSIDPENPLYQFKDANVYPEAPEPARYQPGADALREELPFNDSAETDDVTKLFTDEPMQDLGDMSHQEPAADEDGAMDFQLDMDAEAPLESKAVSAAVKPVVSNPFMEPAEAASEELGGGFTQVPEFSPLPEDAMESVQIGVADEGQVETSSTELPDLDFSNIDLELSSPLHEAGATATGAVTTPVEAMHEAAQPVQELAQASIDPELWEEVNTKLDLAKAYLEMEIGRAHV